MRFSVYYICTPLSTLYFNAPPAPDQHPTPCSHIPPPMPRHSRPYAAYNLSPIPFSAFPGPASLLNHTPPPYSISISPLASFHAPPYTPIPYPHFPPILSLSKNACASLTHTPTLHSSTSTPTYIPLSPALKPTTHNTTQHNSYLCPHEQVRFGKSYPA